MASVLAPAAYPSNVIPLATMPGLGSLYLKALTPKPARTAAALAAKLPGGSPPTVNAAVFALEPVTYHVAQVTADPGHLERYQRLVGEPVDEFLPAGFVHVLAFPAAMAIMVRPKFPLPVAGMIHLANRVIMARPIHHSQTLEVYAWAQSLTAHAKGTAVDLVVEVRSQGEPVWRGVSTYLAKNKYLVGRGETPERPEFEAPVPTAQWRISPRDARAYAAISGDRNPIHTSRLGAKAFGFPKPIAHGMYTAARALADSRALRSEAFEWTVDFGRPVLLPARVALALTSAPTPNTAPDQGHNSLLPLGGGARYTAWNAQSGKQYFSGQVLPLG